MGSDPHHHCKGHVMCPCLHSGIWGSFPIIAGDCITMSCLQNQIVLFLCLVLMVGISSGDHLVSSFSGRPTSGHAPLTVTFTDVSSGGPTGWAWYFGDENYTGSEWKELSGNAPWDTRYGHAAVAMPDGSIVLTGGGPGYKNDVWISLDGGTTWTVQNESSGWPGREFHSAIVLPDGSIVLMGGYNGTYLRDVWRSVDKGVTWTLQAAGAPWAARAKHSSVALPDGSILLMGGFDGTSPKNDVWRSTDKGRTWTQQTSRAGWSARYGLAGVVLPDGCIAVIGGRTSSGYSREMWLSPDQGMTWTNPPLGNLISLYPRGYHSAVALPDGSILVAGGENTGKTVKDMVHIARKTGAWSVERYEIPLAVGRYCHAGVILPDGGLVLMGGTNDTAMKSDVWHFETASPIRDPIHEYREEGTYSVTLQVSGSGGYNTSTRQDLITVYPPLSPPAITGIEPDTGENGTAFIIVNLSGTNFDTMNIPSVKLTRAGLPDILAENVSVHSPSQLTCTISPFGHEAGQRDVIVTNPDGKSGVLPGGFTLTQQPPVADFTARPQSGTAPLAVEFSDTSTGVPSSWTWDFGDGTSGSGKNPLHTYTLPGSYTVTLTVRNGGGSSTITHPDCISVTAVRPPIIGVFSPASMMHGKTVNVAIIGNNFQKGATVRLDQGTATIPVTVTAIIPPSKITGVVSVPASARGRWSLAIRNPDGGECVRANAIIIT